MDHRARRLSDSREQRLKHQVAPTRKPTSQNDNQVTSDREPRRLCRASCLKPGEEVLSRFLRREFGPCRAIRLSIQPSLRLIPVLREPRRFWTVTPEAFAPRQPSTAPKKVTVKPEDSRRDSQQEVVMEIAKETAMAAAPELAAELPCDALAARSHSRAAP